MEKFKALLTWQGIAVIAVVAVGSVWLWNTFAAPRISPKATA